MSIHMPFSLKRPGQYLYSYDYQMEEQWLSREESYDSPETVTTDTIFDDHNLPREQEGYIRISIKRLKNRKICERIDRTSDGTGSVADMTLEEFRIYNYNKTHPEFLHCDIPTLEDVLKLFMPTDMVINIELKNGVNFYPGIELEMIELVEKYGMQSRVIYSSFNHESIKG